MQLPRHTILIAALLGGATLLGGVAIAGGWGPLRGPMGASLLESFDTNDDRTAALAPRLEHYNPERRHSALGGKPPISRLLPT